MSEVGRRTPVKARRLGPGDVDGAVRALRAIHGRAASRTRLGEFLADPSRHVYVATAGRAAIGLAHGYELPRIEDDGVGFVLYEIDTHPDFRRRGAARAILEAMETECRVRGIDTAWVLTNVSNYAAMALYAAAGATRPNDDDAMFRWRFGTPDRDG
jgi:ribosomal protein S18 acetylase RimI-like enzyme